MGDFDGLGDFDEEVVPVTATPPLGGVARLPPAKLLTGCVALACAVAL